VSPESPDPPERFTLLLGIDAEGLP
jgi:hypothetical protein